MKTLFLVLIFVSIAASSASAQQAEKSGIIKTGAGILIVWNESDNFYTVEVKGKHIAPAGNGQQQLYFDVDGRFLQVTTAPLADFWKADPARLTTDQEVLRAHREWELNYLSKMLGKELFPSTEWITLPGNKTALAWSYNVPAPTGSQAARKQFYITTVKGRYIFLVNGALVGTDDEKALRQFLIDTISTLKPSDKPLSLEKASELVKKVM